MQYLDTGTDSDGLIEWYTQERGEIRAFDEGQGERYRGVGAKGGREIAGGGRTGEGRKMELVTGGGGGGLPH